MRMWNLPVETLCLQHLLGEHVETHMFAGSLNKGKNLRGFIDRGLFEPAGLRQRHDVLATELLRRGCKHNSVLPPFEIPEFRFVAIDIAGNLKDLHARCWKCREMYVKFSMIKNVA